MNRIEKEMFDMIRNNEQFGREMGFYTIKDLVKFLFDAGIRPKEGFEIDLNAQDGQGLVGQFIKPKQYEEE